MHRETSPNAAESITKNAYLDNICDSVRTAEEARELTEDIDKVLATSGFRMKKWITNAPSSDDKDSEDVVLGGEAQTEDPVNFCKHIAHHRMIRYSHL